MASQGREEREPMGQRGESVDPRVRYDWHWHTGASDYWLNPQLPAAGWQEEKYAGKVKVTRNAWNGLPELEPFIDGLRKAAEGLEDPEMLLLSDHDPEEFPLVYVQGWRPVTVYDQERLDARAAKIEEAEREQYEALRARFETGQSGSDVDTPSTRHPEVSE